MECSFKWFCKTNRKTESNEASATSTHMYLTFMTEWFKIAFPFQVYICLFKDFPCVMCKWWAIMMLNTPNRCIKWDLSSVSINPEWHFYSKSLSFHTLFLNLSRVSKTPKTQRETQKYWIKWEFWLHLLYINSDTPLYTQIHWPF